jgi:DNA-binding transcriptional LysR family regulator
LLEAASIGLQEANLPTLKLDDVVVARTEPDATGLDSAALAPTPAILLVPAGHRLAPNDSVSLADLDGERLLTWSPPGTPYTDLLVSRVAASGARVESVQAQVTGGTEPLRSPRREQSR